MVHENHGPVGNGQARLNLGHNHGNLGLRPDGCRQTSATPPSPGAEVEGNRNIKLPQLHTGTFFSVFLRLWEHIPSFHGYNVAVPVCHSSTPKTGDRASRLLPYPRIGSAKHHFHHLLPANDRSQ